MKSKRKVLLALNIAQRAYYRGIIRYAREHDWHLVMDMVYTGRVPIGWRGDGILTILGYRKELVDFIQTASVPTVAITLVNEQIDLPRVEGDNVRIGRLAAQHFLERGYRNFAWAPFLNDVMNSERFAGFAQTLQKKGFACRALPPAHSLVGRVWQDDWAKRRRTLIRELQELPRPAAVFAYNDAVAADVIDACRDAGLLVPEQIAVLGVDNDPDVCDCAPVPLSSIEHDLEGMAYRGAALLDRLMSGRPVPKKVPRVVPRGVVTRTSTDIHALDNVKVAIAVRYIANHYPNGLLAVTDIARAADISRRQLERVFREAMGCSVNAHLARVRLLEVERRLVQTRQTILQIARETGFNHPTHLFRAWRAHSAVSPRRFRKRAWTSGTSPLPPDQEVKPLAKSSRQKP